MQTDNQNRSVKNGWGEKLKLGLRNTLSNVGLFNLIKNYELRITKSGVVRKVVCAGMLALQAFVVPFAGCDLPSIARSLFGAQIAQAATGIAHTVNYQGRLLTTGGTSVPDGTYQMEFRLYTAASGGSHLWSASTTDATPTGSVAAIDTTVTNGLFSVLLGDEANGQVAFPEDIFNNDGLYLGVTIGADSEMTPRKRLSAVPYAYNSETLQGQYASHTVANTGGSLFALNLGSTDAAVANRSAFYVHTSGTSDTYDFLMRADSGSSLFSITRQGNVTTTGNLQVDGHTILGNSTSDMLTVNARVSSDLTPAADVTYNLGLPALRWKSLYAANVSSTNIEASGYVSTTQLFINGAMITGIETQDLQDVTDLGALTTNWLQFAGATSTADFRPSATDSYSLGTNVYRWKNLFASTGVYSSSTVQTLNLTVYGNVASDLIPSTNNTYSLGSISKSWKNIYASSTAYLMGDVYTRNVTTTGIIYTGATRLNTDTGGPFVYVDEPLSATPAAGTRQGYIFAVGSNYFLDMYAQSTGAANGIQNASVRFYQTLRPDQNNTTDIGAFDGAVKSLYVSSTSYLAALDVGGHVIPRADNTYDLGSTTNKWRNLFTTFVSTTNLLATGYVSTTELYINGTQFTPGAETQDLQDVTDLGAITTNWIQFAGATSTADLRPSITNSYNLGSTAYAWKKLFATNVSSTNIDASGYVSSTNMYAAMFTGNLTGDVTGNVSGQAGYVANSLTNGTGIAFLNFNGSAATSVALTNTGVSAGYYGTTLQIPNLLIDAQGRIVAASTTNLGTIALQDSDNVSITGGTISGLTHLSVTNVSSTNIDASGYVSTAVLYVNGTQVTGIEAQDLQDVTDLGAITTNWLQFAGATSTADFRPSATDSYSLGTSAYRWKNLFASTGVYSSSTIQTLNLTVYGNVASSLTPSANNTFDLGSITNSWKNIYASSTAYLMGDVYTRNVTTTGIIYTGATRLTTDAGGPLVLIDEPLSATPAAGTRQGYIFSVGSNRFLDMYAQSTGAADTVQNASVRFYQTLRPDQNNTTDIGAFDGAVKSLYVSSTSYLAALDVGGHVIPRANNTYDLGSTTNKWRNLFTTFVSTTNLLATGYVSTTALYINGTAVSAGGSQTLQQVTDLGATSNHWLQFAGATSTSNFLPGTNNSYNLGSTAYAWKKLFATNVSSTNIDASGYVSSTNMYAVMFTGNLTGDVTGNVSGQAGYVANSLTNGTGIAFLNFNGSAATSVALTNTGVSAGYYGTTLQIPNLLIDAQGRIVAASTTNLGTMALQDSNNVSITGGTISGLTHLSVTNVSSTNIDALGYVSTTQLYINGTLVTGTGTQDLQDVTDLGAITTNWIQFAGATSTADFRPSATDSYSLGTSAYRWKNLFASTGVYSSSTIQTLNLTVYGNVASDLIPSVNNTYSLGSISKSWKNIYASSTSYLAALDVGGHIIPRANNTYDLGSSANRWRNLFATSVSTTNLLATGYVSTTQLYINGTLITGTGAQDLQDVTDLGALTTNWIQFAGATSTADFRPSATDSYSLGTSAYRWKNLFASTGVYSSSTIQTLNLTVYGNVASSLTPSANNTFDLGSITNSWKSIYASSTAYLMGDVYTRNVTTTGILYTGATRLTTDAGGPLVLIDESLSATPAAGTQQGYIFSVGSNYFLNMYAESAGAADTVQNASVRFYQTLRPDQNNTTDIGAFDGAVKSLYVSSTSYLAALDVGGHVIPRANNTYDLGSTTNKWRNLFTTFVSTTNLLATGYVSTTALYINGTAVTGGGGNLQVTTDLGYVTDNPIQVAGVSSTADILPTIDNSYNLGSATKRWLNLYSTFITSTNILATGYVSTTQLYINGTLITGTGAQDLQDVTDLGALTTNWIQFAGATSTSNFLPGTNNLYNLGSTAYAWKKLFSTNVSSTNIDASGYVSTAVLYVNGTQVTGIEAQDLQDVTDLGAITTNWLQFAGATSTADFRPSATDSYNLGTSAYRWKNLFASTGVYSSSTIQTLNLTVYGNVASDLIPSTNNTYSLGSISKSWKNIYASSTAYLMGDVYTRNVTTTGIIYTGATRLNTDTGGPFVYVDEPLSATPAAGTRQGYIFAVGSNYFLDMYAQSTGAANGIQNASVRFYQTLRPDQNNTTDIGAFDGAVKSLYVSSTSYLAALDVGGHVIPRADNTYDLGSTTNKWRNLFTTFVSTTNLLATGYVSTTELYINGTQFTPGAETQDLQDVTDLGVTTNHWLQFAGATSTADFRPSATDSYNLGTNVYRWKNLFASTGVYSSSTIQTLNLTVYGNVASSLTPSANNTFDLGSITNSWKNIYASSTAYLMGDVYTRNVTTTGIIYTGATRLTTDAGGPLVLIDEPLSATPAAGTRQGYIFSVGSNRFLDMYAQSTGAADTVQNASVRFYQTLRPDQNNSTDIGAFSGAVKSLYVSSTSYLAALDVGGHVIPRADNTYDLGSTTNKWRNLFTTFVSTTNLLATGYVSTTALYINGTAITGGGGNLQVTTDLGYVTDNPIQVAGVSSTADILPTVDNSYNLGSATKRWLNLYSTFITSTNILATGYVSTTQLYINGTLITGTGAQDLQDVTDLGALTTNWIQFAGATSTADFRPSATDSYSLGTSAYRWKNLFASTGVYSSSTVQTLNLTVYGNVASSLTPSANNTFDLGSITNSWKSIYASSTAYLMGDVYTRNVTTTGILYTGATRLTTDAGGPLVLIDESLSATPAAGTQQGYIFSVGSNYFLNMYAESAGAADTVQNASVRFYQTLRPDQNNSTDIGAFDGAVKSLYVSSTSYLAALDVGGHVIPRANNTYDLGSTTNKWRNLFTTFVSTTNLLATGYVSTTALYINGTAVTGGGGNLQVTTDLGYVTDNPIQVAGVSSTADILPTIDNSYNLGSATKRWLNLYSTFITSTNILATGYVSTTALYINGTQVSPTGGTADLQDVTDLGATTNHWIQIAGVTSTADMRPGTNNLYDLGTSNFKWRNLFATSVSTTNLLASGYVSTTALYINGTLFSPSGEVQDLQAVTDLGVSTNKWIQFAGATSTSDFRPSITNSYNLGTSAYRWKNLWATNATFTTLYVNGVAITGGGNQDLQDVTDNGYVTTNPIQTAGVSTTGNILPVTSLSYDLGSSSNRWKDVWASSTRVGTSTWDIWQADQGFTISNNDLANRYFTINNNGYVGVGTAYPSSLLSIAGGATNDASTNYGDENTVEIGGYVNTPYLSMGQYQNFLLQTEVFDNASWLKSNLSGAVAANGWYSPEDTKIAEGIPAGNAADSHIKQNITNATTGNWTFSVWLKAQSGTAPVSLRIDSNTQTGAAKQVVLTTQWQRYSVTQNLSAAHATSGVFIVNGTNAIAAWGAQLEPVAAPRVYSGPLTTTAITTLTKYSKFRSNLSSYGSITSSAGIAAGGAISGASTITATNYITQTIPTLYVSTEGHVMTAAVSTGVTAALVPLSLSPRIRQIGQAWDVDGAVNTLESYWQEVIPYASSTVNSKLSWYHAQGAMATANEYQAPEIMNYYNNSLNVLGSTYGSNVLRDGTFASGSTYWTAGTGWTMSGTTATYTYNATPNGTLSQSSANFLVPVKPNRWYRFTYSTLNQNTTVNVYIDPLGISQERVYLRSVNIATPGTWTTTFKTNSNPGNFILTGYGAGASDKCDFQNVSLVEVQSGNIVANGMFTGGGTDGIKIDQNGNVGIGTTSPNVFKLQVAGNVGPSSTNAYDLGSSTYKWRNLFTTYASTTNLLATGYVSTTALYINGTQITGGGITGSGTDNRIMRWNNTGTAQDSLVTIDDSGNLYPYVNNEADLGMASNSWNNIYASSTIFSGAATGVNFRFTTSGYFEANNTSGVAFAFYPKQTPTNGGLYFIGDKDFNHALFIKDATHTSIGADYRSSFALTVGGNVGPYTNNSYDLGTFGYAWKDVYASGTIRGGVLLSGDGNSAAPGFAFAGNPDTGFYNQGGTLVETVGGSSASYLDLGTMYLASNGAIGAGLALYSPTGDYQMIRSNTAGSLYTLTLPAALPGSTQFLISDDAGNLSWSAGSGTGITGAGTDNRIMRWNGTGAAQDSLVTIDDTGKVGIGDTSPLALLTVGASDAFQVSSAGNVFVPNGAINAPSYSFVSNPDTGIYLSGSTLSFTLDSIVSSIVEAGNISVFSPSISSGASMHLSDNSNNGFLVGIRAPVTLSNEYELILPTDLPGSTQFLVSDTSGNLSWSAGSGAGITGSGVDNHIMRWNGTGAAQSSNTIIDDTGNVMPSSTLTMDLGSSSYRWKDLWVSSTYIGDSTWNLREAGSDFVIADKSGGDNEIFRIYTGTNGAARLQGIDADLNIKTTQDSTAQVSFSNTSGIMGYAGFSGNDFTIMNNAVSNGLYFGTNATSKVVLYTNYFAPVANNTYELGDATHKWKNLFVGNVSSTSLLANGPIVQTASTPTRVASITMNNSSYYATDVQIDGDRVAYVDTDQATNSTVYIGQLRQQTLTYKVAGPIDNARSVKLVGSILYVNTGASLVIYDVTNLSSSSVLGTVDYDVTVNNSWIDVSGRYAYVGSYSDAKMYKIDVSDPKKPVLIHTKNITGIYGIQASYPYVYLTRNGVGVSILDVSNPSTSTVIGTYALATAAASYVEGSIMYALGTNGNLYAVDISMPGSLVQFASKAIGRAPGLPSKMIVRNGLVYILENNNYFSIWRLNGSSFDRVYQVSDTTYLRSGYAMDIEGNTMVVFAGDGSTHYISTYNLRGTTIDTMAAGTIDVSKLTVKGQADFASGIYVEGEGLFTGGVHANGPSAFTTSISTLGSQSLSNGFFTVDNENVSFIDSRSVYGSTADSTSVKVNLFAMATGTDLTTGDTQLGATYNIVASMPYTLNNVAGGDNTPNVNIYGYMSALGSNPRKIYTLANLSIYNGVNGLFYNEDGTAANALLARSNDTNNATAHFINSASSTSATTLYINQGGANTIGTRILQVWNAVDGTPKMSVRGNGAVYADTGYNTAGGDYAEWMRHDNLALIPGEVVALDLVNATSVARSTYVNRNKTVGIVSSNPSVVGNTPGGDSDYEIKPTEWAMVGMLGQLMVKFSDVYGVVNTGDKLMAGDDGYAVKAKSSGMVLGEALASASATGTVMVYLHPHWWAGDLLAADGSVNLVTNNLSMQAKGTADETTQGYDSHAFSFNGSGWDQNASSSVATSFQVNNHTVNSTSSGLEFSFATGTNSGNLGTATSVFSISNQGNVTATGDLTVGKRLFLGSKTTGFGSSSTYIFVDDTLAPTSTYIATNADGWMTSSTYDYAERYESKEDLQPGDLVTVDANGVNLVKRSTSPNEPILGIVSTRPGFVTGGYMKGNFPIALAGRVPTRVSIVNGVIQVGDYLTASTVPGVAVKAIGPGNVVGVALESYSGAQEGLISVFVKPSYTAGSIGESGTPSTVVNNYSTPTTDQQTEIEGLALITAGAKQVHISYDSVLAYPMVYATPNASLDGGSWWIDNRTDTGFDIVISAAQSHDIEFSWLVRTMLPGTIRFVSDNTHYPVDNLTGQMVGPQKPTDEQPTSTPATPPDTTPTSTPVTPPTSTPDSTPTSTPTTPPPVEDASSSTSTTTPP